MIKWEKDGFRIELKPNGYNDCRTMWTYWLFDGDWLMFYGEEFSTPNHIDGNRVVAELIGFLTLKPGDTDDEYFNDYMECQMDWCLGDRCEELKMIGMEMEEST